METDSLQRDSFREQLGHPAIGAFYDYWTALPREQGLPGRSHIDPQAIPSLLQWLMLVDVEELIPKARFRYRLAGTGVVRLFGREFTGLTNREAFPQHATRLTADFLDVVNRREPVYHRTMVPMPGREFRNIERLLCPLAEDGQTVNMLVGVVCAPV